MLRIVGVAACASLSLACGPETTIAGAMDPPIAFRAACNDSLEEVSVVPPDLPPFDDGQRGKLVRCAPNGVATVADILAANPDAPLSADLGDVHLFRIAYRTERLAEGNGPRAGISGADLLVPDDPRSPDVLAVSAHGTVGMSATCLDMEEAAADASSNLAVAGAGFLTVAPDYTGFMPGEVLQGWLSSEDEGHAVLDATRAVAELLAPGATPSRVVLYGQSQGGHAVLSAQAMASSYGMSGELAGVAAFAPAWFPLKILGGEVLAGHDPAGEPTALDLTRAVYYFVSRTALEGEPRDAVIAPDAEKRTAVALQRLCSTEFANVVAHRGLVPADFFLPDFVAPVTSCALTGACDTGLGARWEPRFQADRPHVDAAGAPIVMWQGLRDERITPNRAQCAVDRLEADVPAPADGSTPKFVACADVGAGHLDIETRHLDWLIDYLALRGGLGPPPAPCPSWAERAAAHGAPACPVTDD